METRRFDCFKVGPKKKQDFIPYFKQNKNDKTRAEAAIYIYLRFQARTQTHTDKSI